jgi:hypothetical protein
MTDDELLNALDCAVTAAEAGSEATVAIWKRLTPEEQAQWLQRSATSLPRYDLFLKPILAAAQQIIDDDRRAQLPEGVYDHDPGAGAESTPF